MFRLLSLGALLFGILCLLLASYFSFEMLSSLAGFDVGVNPDYLRVVSVVRAGGFALGLLSTGAGALGLRVGSWPKVLPFVSHHARTIGLSLFSVSIALFLGLCIYFFHYTVDDAFIVFRYSQNFAQGFGLNWNPGENPVEGYSGLSWVLMAAIPEYFGWNTELVMKGVATLFGLGTLGLVFAWTRRLTGHWIVSGLVSLLVAAVPAFAFWTMGGLETTMSVFFVLFTAWWIDRNLSHPKRWIFSAPLFWWLAITRPEGILYFVLSWFFVAGISLNRKTLRADFRHLFWWGLVFSLGFIGFHLLRYTYYGYFFANPYYVKHFTGGGLPYLARFLVDFSPLFVLAFYTLYRDWKAVHTYLLLMMAVPLIMVVNIVPQMGYHYRFIMPSVVILVILSAEELQYLFQIFKKTFFPARWLAGIAMVMLSATLLGQAPVIHREFVLWELDQVPHVLLGQWLHENMPSDTLIAVNDAGAIGYYSQLPLLDILGLNDETIAHEGFTADYVYAQAPDLLINVSLSPDTFIPEELPYLDLWEHPDFARYTLLRTFPYDETRTYFLFQRNES